MNDIKIVTPVLFLVFNRPDTTLKVFDRIRKAKPSKLFIACDGPRPHMDGELKQVEEVRSIVQRIDWECEVKTLFRDENLGCKLAVSGAIDWFFGNVEEGIILEDDCLPDDTFFRFCQELLDMYRNDERIMVVSGTNFLRAYESSQYSYYFSKYNSCWGWATWRRAWKFYDLDLSLWPYIRDNHILENTLTKTVALRWRWRFEAIYRNKMNDWSPQFILARILNSGLTIVPTNNLISNIGFDGRATHTKVAKNKIANLRIYPVEFPLRHNPFIISDINLEDFYSNLLGRKKELPRLKKIVQGVIQIIYSLSDHLKKRYFWYDQIIKIIKGAK